MKKLFVIILLFISVFSFADDNTILLEKGNKAYNDKFYQEAINNYLNVIKNGLESPSLYYNLGNAYFKKEEYAAAILYFEKAKKLNPNDEDILYNLNVANSKIVDKIDELPEFFLLNWYNAFVSLFSFNTWAIIGIGLLVISLAFLTLYLFSKTLRIRKISFWVSIVLFMFTLFTFIFTQTQYTRFKTNKEAIIFAASVTVKSSPDEKSTDLFVVHEGLKIRITDTAGEWSEIKIANGSVGWIKTAVFKVI